jgi:hypothetical protein
MAMGRIELRLNPGNPDERPLIDTLEALGNEYGAKTRFLKERLFKGLQVILEETEDFLRTDDPTEALERFSMFTDIQHYRLLKALLDLRIGVTTGIAGRQKKTLAPPQKRAPGMVEASPAKMDVPGTEAMVTGTIHPEKPPPGRHDWSNFAGIAGARKGG